MTIPITHTAWRNISGNYYDWTITKQPERPYLHDYSKTLSMKLGMANPDQQGGSIVYCTFEQALTVIKETDKLTRGIPKIFYLVGWQYNGHDDKYPAWHEVNEALKRPEDATARDSYLWLMEEAKQYNTTVSVHANMTDAYQDSPLWEEYTKQGAIARFETGEFLVIGSYNNREAYQISYKEEWESGLAVARIDALIELLQLDEAKTVHLDAFFPRTNPSMNYSEEDQSIYMRKIIRYFRDRDIDVTSENFGHYRNDPFIGLQPWCWWFDMTRETLFMERPAALLTGAYIRDYCLPDIPRRYDLEFMFGATMHGEGIFYDEEKGTIGDRWDTALLEEFCKTTLRYQFLNHFERLQLEGETERRIVTYSDDLVLHLYEQTMHYKGCLLQEKTDLFIPALWQTHLEIIAYSDSGYLYPRTWTLPPQWHHVDAVDIYTITKTGLQPLQSRVKLTSNYQLQLDLAPKTALAIVPAGTNWAE
ncbi:endo-alpha-N-acetylgalactosaminidase family protein [Paenibacillus yanchengensis]|uniref:Endo-alpha-N-acetylgalactosaminidase family protein n=1 Tax=Paenibacillus yanchengensis TaxID=2035833 RepID=A0ABW4YIJ5_9BACL